MFNIDIGKMTEINAGLFTSATRTAFGTDGQSALKHLLSCIVQIYRRIEPGIRSHPLVLFADATATASVVVGAARRVHSISTMTTELDGACMVRVLPDGSLEIRELDISALDALSQTAVVYIYNGGAEKFIIRGEELPLPNPVVGYASALCKPTFTTLATALENYRVRVASHTSCLILKQAWIDEARWWFKTKPEEIMRQSLTQYLQQVLVDANVRPEQNVDETHPVDIHVGFSMTFLHAIIEIKWLGKSMDAAGKEATGYAKGRASEGARQLAEYLDSSTTWAPGFKTRGFLVVFDGRRKGLKEGVASLDATNALHYKDEDIAYTIDYTKQRNDFNEPVRMYMYPKTA